MMGTNPGWWCVTMALIINLGEVSAQDDSSGIGLRYRQQSGMIGLTRDVLTASMHPVGPEQITDGGAAVQASRPTWPLSPLTLQASVILKTQSGSFSFPFRYNGFLSYHQMQTGVGYARRFTQWLKAGIRASYYRSGTPVYGISSALPLDAGISIQLSPSLITEIAAYNLVAIVVSGPEAIDLQRVLTSGLTYVFSDMLGLGLYVHSDNRRGTAIQCQIAYRLHERLLAEMDYHSGSNAFSVAAMFGWNALFFRVGFTQMLALGSQAQLGIQYSFKKTKQ